MADIVLVSSGQPSLNPRLVKEADTLVANGHDVLVIYAYWNNWATQLDEDLLSKRQWKAIRVGGHPKHNKLVYLISRLIFKMAGIAAKKLKLANFADLANARASYFLIREAKKHKADLYIGHNLGALPAVAKAAHKFHRPCGFDVEDMHRYEASNDDQNPDVWLKTQVENKYFPLVSYLTVSSDQIGDAYTKIFPGKKFTTLRNVFPKSAVTINPSADNKAPLKLLWFSQTIGTMRGLEVVVEALLTIKSLGIELHLLGDLPDGEFKDYLDAAKTKGLKIFNYAPVPSDALTDFAAQFDIGLATEPAFSINNDAALSNKIFTYIQAGLAIIASDTSAQKQFLNDYPAIGKVYEKGNVDELATILTYYQQNRPELLNTKNNVLQLAQTELNWETESKKFTDLLRNILP